MLSHMPEETSGGRQRKAKAEENSGLGKRKRGMNAKTIAYRDKVRAELRQAKAQLAELEARSKAEDEQAGKDLINDLKSTHQKIEQQREKLESSAVEEMEQEQTEIDAEIAKLKSGLAELDRRLKSGPRARAS